jgi:O-antigen biosynthesis protein
MSEPAPVTVVVPTIGRSELLGRCLGSLSECRPPAAEILVVDQSGDPAVVEGVGRFAAIGARIVSCEGLGTARARNLGLREASSTIVLFTDDDCTVDTGWVGAAAELVAAARDQAPAMITGRVLPRGDPERVPSTKEDTEPQDHTGGIDIGALYSNNMAVERSALLDFGGFDERFGAVAEDVDLCYRWLRAGGTLRYEPGIVVWHHDWRTDAQLDTLYRGYWRGMGVFYAKHLHHPDPVVLRLLGRSLFHIVRATVRRTIKGRERARSGPPGLARAFLAGLAGRWRSFG